jgi:mannose-6-phosphate isomerase-like protein (cupin superfamily)
MKTQRIVTGHDQAGRSTVASSGPLPSVGEFRQFPGFAVELIWQTAPGPIPAHPVDPGGPPHSVLPAPGGSSAMLVTFPPEGEAVPADFDPQAAARELCERLPGLGELFEADAPGFHRSETIDYGVLLEGELTLELDECTRVLRRGDVVVQMGTRHAWRNTGNSPARMLFVMVGATRGQAVA